MQRTPHLDALVIFGITGDLAYKKIFPALQALVASRTTDGSGHRRGTIGTLDNLVERARASLEADGSFDQAVIRQARCLVSARLW